MTSAPSCALLSAASLWLGSCAATAAATAGSTDAPPTPNVILLMTDDQGWGDLGLRGHPRLETPHLDEMARSGVRLDRFYAASPVCSPTRASVLTGRHPARMGIGGANSGHLPATEHTLAEELHAAGYRTGHFGKWHLGTLTTEVKDSNRGRPGATEHYSPPWEHGFDVCFSTEAKVPTFDPMVTPAREHGGVARGLVPGGPYGTAYWTGPGERVTEGLEGDDSALIMDRALTFIDAAVAEDRPFLAVVWLHAPTSPWWPTPPARGASRTARSRSSTSSPASKRWTTASAASAGGCASSASRTTPWSGSRATTAPRGARRAGSGSPAR